MMNKLIINLLTNNLLINFSINLLLIIKLFIIIYW